MSKNREMTFKGAVAILALALAILLIGVIVMGLDPHVPILINIGIVMAVSRCLGVPWGDMVDYMIGFLGRNISVVVIIMLVGVVVGSFMTCGTVPLVIYYGLKIMSAKWFLVCAMLVCFVMGLLTGSSFTTVGTIGVAFMGVGISLGIPVGVTAGAIITGALTGDKHSPLGAATNLAAAVSGVSVYETEACTRYTTLPTLALAAAVFTAFGSRYSSAGADTQQVDAIIAGLQANYDLSPLMLIPIILLFVLVLMKIPAIPTLIFSSLVGVIFSVVFQGVSLADSFLFMERGYVAETGVELLDPLLSRGGLLSMASTIMLIVLGLSLAGALEKLSVMALVTEKLSARMNGRFSVMTGSFFMSFLLTCFSGDCHMAIVLTANSMKKCFEKVGVHPAVMSRCINDGSCGLFGTIPWCIGGVYFAGVLGVPVAEFAPFYLIGFGTVIFTVLSALTGIGARKAER